MDAGKWECVLLGVGVQLPEINAESQSSVLLVHQDDSIAPHTVTWGYGSYVLTCVPDVPLHPQVIPLAHSVVLP